MFGLLHNRFHEAWSLRKGPDLQDRPRYTHTTTVATFPFPEGMAPDQAVAAARALRTAPAIETAAKRLDELRNGWLYPADLIQHVPESVAGFPTRCIAKDQKSAKLLAGRTLTSLYNERPRWLVEAHRVLDEAVAKAYDWPADISTDEALRRLLDLNLSRSASNATGLTSPELGAFTH